MPNEPTTGNSRRRHGAPPTGYSRIPIRSVSKMNPTTASPVNAPITSAKTRNTCSSRCRSSATRSDSQVLHHLPLIWMFSFLSRECPSQEHISLDLPAASSSPKSQPGRAIYLALGLQSVWIAHAIYIPAEATITFLIGRACIGFRGVFGNGLVHAFKVDQEFLRRNE